MPNTLGRLRGLILDMDGTIADTEELHRRAFNRAFAAMGLPVSWDVAEHRRRLPQGSGPERLAKLLAEPRFEARCPTPEAAVGLAGELHRRKTAFFLEEIGGSALQLRPGIRRLLIEAGERGLITAVASTAAGPSVRGVLDTGLGRELAGRFVSVLSGSDVRQKKPHPEVYLRSLSAMGLPADSVVAIEDTRLGLLAARAAGLTTVVTYTHWSDGQDFSEAAVVADSLGEPTPGPACELRHGPAALGRPECLTLSHLAALLG